ncbi:efflux RND transporter periplasmic adaptor subunit [Massilia sp. TS11]|uniref:efflux RND transporter periplasmic adaptor subunit n=1 Tax=Massilia sp. TS11 TaxID=2908003 RepID=UPI001EDBC5ED|nr:efflux RND transporter periplasmic adaptor subunit [Massilia sp. TS11]MCG2584893.1 efflux RND transporter periplasmic adaptor subunit [Massilia sp. TS11]
MKKTTIASWLGAAAIVGAGAWYLQGGSHENAAPAAAAKNGPGNAPTVVNLVKPQRQDVPVIVQATGTVAPVAVVDLRPQTAAKIQTVHIQEGQFVRKGQLLFSLDDRNEKANLEKALAQVARDQAQLADAERQYKRAQELVAQKFIAASQVDTLRSGMEAARALLQADQAAAQAARVAASYTVITAPMAGRVGGINVFPGSLVQATTSLTTITQLDPIDVSFTLPEGELGAVLAAQKSGKVAVDAVVGAGGKPVRGELSFVDNSVDATSGTIKVKARFANPDQGLWPGQYVTTRVTTRVLKDATVVPQAAIITNTRGTFVYAVDADQSAKQVKIQRLHAFGDQAAVAGLNGDEQIITEGKQNLRPGGKIKPAPAAKPASAAASGSASASAKGK